MNVNEYGVGFAFSTSYNMSAYTTITINFTKPDGTTLSVSNPDVTVPNVDLPTSLGTFLANKYAQYIFQNGDVDQEGVWSARVVYTDATPTHLISDPASFTVSA